MNWPLACLNLAAVRSGRSDGGTNCVSQGPFKAYATLTAGVCRANNDLWARGTVDFMLHVGARLCVLQCLVAVTTYIGMRAMCKLGFNRAIVVRTEVSTSHARVYRGYVCRVTRHQRVCAWCVVETQARSKQSLLYSKFAGCHLLCAKTAFYTLPAARWPRAQDGFYLQQCFR